MIITMVITFLISYIGVNLKNKKKDEIKIVKKLDIPEIFSSQESETEFNVQITFTDGSEEEDKTIILE